MILTLCLLTLLAASNTGAQRIKGGRRIIQEPAVLQDVSQPHVHFGKGGVGGALHHTAVVTDPVSLNPVVVEKVTSLGSGGGIKTSGLGGLGASSAQFTLADSQIPSFGQRGLYRVGQSQVPFGLSGLDYYSYPASLLSRRRGLGGKTVFADNLSGLSPIGLGRQSAILADPTTSQFTVGDAQIRSSPFGGSRLYRTGVSSVPFGLSGLDYYSYPRNLLTRGGLLGGGLGQTKILSGGGFTAGDSQVRGLLSDPLGQEQVIVSGPQEVVPQQVTVIGDGGFGQRQVVTQSGGLGGLRGGQILLRGGHALGGYRRVKSRPIIQAAAPVQEVQVLVDPTSGLGAPIGGYGQRQVVTKSIAPAPVVHAPIIAAPVISTPVRRVINRGLGEAFITQAVRPRIAARRVVQARPVAQFVHQPAAVAPGNIQFTLGNTQIIGGPIAAAPAHVFSAPRQTVAVQRPVVAIQRPTYVQRPVVQVQRPTYAQRPVVQVQRPVVAVQRPVVAVQRPVVAVKQPQVISQVKTSGFGGRRIFGRQIPQMFYVDGGSRFPGLDTIGGYRIGDPRYNYAQLPISTQRFANLGLSQGSIDAGPILVAPAPVPSFLSTKSSPLVSGGGIVSPITKSAISQGNALGLAGIGQSSSKLVTQEEVIGPAGDRQIVTTVTDAGPSKIGGQVVAGPLGLHGIGHTGSTKTVTQEEVIGPAGDSQIVTTVTKSSPSKIGGAALGGHLGLSGIGKTAPTQVVTQEEVIGPAGDSQILTAVTNAAPSKIGGPVVSGPLGLTGIGHTGATKTITQEEVIGPAGDSQIVTTVTKSSPSKIGGAVVGSPLGLTAVGHTSPAKVVTQEEVIGPSGDSQIVTTITESGSVPSKIGGAAVGSPFGFSGAGQGQQVISQEEVIGPAGDTQIITTVAETSPTNIIQQEELAGLSGISSLTSSPFSQEISQDPIESALSQHALGDSALISTGSSFGGPIGQSIIDPVGAGQTQLSVGDVLSQSPFSDISGGGVSQQVVKETTITDGATGTPIAKVTELSQQPIGGLGLSDPISQQSISSGFGNGLGYVPRVSFLSHYPYDVPDRALLRQTVARPIVQEQQQLEQFFV